ncbi:MAG: response regulator transcription factor [Armatimonadetes bacterium]|nr:response regulator transcription factor [Armatimonadota bacterium]
MAERILVVDDEDAIVEFVEINLRRAGYDVLKAFNGEEALRKVRAEAPDLVVLDVMMPEMDGFQVCQEIRRFSTVPVIMLTARSEDKDKITGLDTGADAYLVKPFNPDELIAWIQAVIRRASTRREESPARIIFGDLSIDPVARKVWRDGKPVELSPRETDLMIFFASNPGRIFTRAEVRRGVWGDEFLEERSVDVHVRRLREKIGDDALEPRYIITVWGTGYKANPEIAPDRG